MRIDRLITIQFLTKGKSASGEPTEDWATIPAVTEWANVEPLSGKEAYSEGSEQLVAVEMLRFTIRFRGDVRPGTARIQHQGRTYNIRRVAETERNRWLQCDGDCKTA